MSDTLNRRKIKATNALRTRLPSWAGSSLLALATDAVDAADAAVNREGAEDVLEDFLRGDGPDDTFAEMLNRAIDVALGRQSNE